MPYIQFQRTDDDSNHRLHLMLDSGDILNGKYNLHMRMKNIGNGTAKDIEYAYQWDNLTKCHDRGAFPVQALSAGESQIIKVAFEHSLSGTEKCTACFILRYRDLLENDYTQKLTFNFIRNSSKTLSLENLTTSSPEFTPKVATNV